MKGKLVPSLAERERGGEAVAGDRVLSHFLPLNSGMHFGPRSLPPSLTLSLSFLSIFHSVASSQPLTRCLRVLLPCLSLCHHALSGLPHLFLSSLLLPSFLPFRPFFRFCLSSRSASFSLPHSHPFSMSQPLQQSRAIQRDASSSAPQPRVA